jgi:hypothetical protein
MPRETKYHPGAGTKPEETDWGPYAYAGTNTDGTGGGWQAGFGIQSGTAGSKDGWHGGSHLLKGNGFFGLNHDGAIGAGGGAQVARLEGGYGERGKGNYFAADADALGAGFDSWVNPDKGAAMGASAYLLQGSVTAGNIGTGVRDEENRIGLGAGVGAAGRLHWEDADGDGRREYGFGADIGPLSFDMKSEDPLLSLAKMTPLGLLASPLAGLLPDDFNLTETVGNGIGSAANWIGDTASSIGGGIADGVGAAANWVGDTASSIGGGISNAAGAAVDWAGDTASSIGNGVADAAGAAWDFATSW